MANFGRKLARDFCSSKNFQVLPCILQKRAVASHTFAFNRNAFVASRSQQTSRPYSTYKPPINSIVMFVPQQEAWVVERMGKFYKILQPVSVFNYCR